MNSNQRPAVGDNVNVMLYGYAESATITAVSDNGKMLLVRHDPFSPARAFTLRADGRYIIKGKQTQSVNAASLDITA